MKPEPFVPDQCGEDPRYVCNRTDNRTWHRTHTRTLYADTDRSQVVYHANYLRYFELGRVTLMRDAAYSYREIEESGYIYPIIEIGITYHAPLYYDDPMWVHSRPGKLERVRLQFDYVITHAESGALVCRGFTRHCATNGAGVPVGVDEKTRQLWRNFPG